ncbi:hypothetical protein Hanom_Chr03g00209351 [Helianthus anomalus]
MNIIACFVLNRPYNISQVIFNHMLDNIKGEYPRFVQMLLDDQIPNFPKDPSDELPLDHMDSETLKRLDRYRVVKPEDEPRYQQKFGKIKKSDYVAPVGDNWRHADSNSENETEGLKLMVEKKLRFWFMKEEKRKITPKVPTPKVVIKEMKKKKSPPRLVDETLIPPTDMIKEGTDLLKMPFAEYDKLSTAQGAQVEQDTTRTAENVEAGGENVEKKFVEGEVHTDSSATESDDIYPTMIAPTSYVSGKQKLKKSPKKKKASGEEDATYELTPTEKEKIKKKAPKTVEDPTSATKKPTTSQTSSHGFPKVPSDLPSGFDDWFHDEKINFLTRKVSILEKGKAKVEAELKKTKEKLGDIKEENVALREEVEQQSEVIEGLVDKIMEVNAQYKSVDGSNKML